MRIRSNKYEVIPGSRLKNQKRGEVFEKFLNHEEEEEDEE
jgi:hypothetical protein